MSATVVALAFFTRLFSAVAADNKSNRSYDESEWPMAHRSNSIASIENVDNGDDRQGYASKNNIAYEFVTAAFARSTI